MKYSPVRWTAPFALGWIEPRLAGSGAVGTRVLGLDGRTEIRESSRSGRGVQPGRGSCKTVVVVCGFLGKTELFTAFSFIVDLAA